MRVPKWLPFTLGVMILPAIYLGVKWSRPEVATVSHPPAPATAPAQEKPPSEPESNRPTIIAKVHGSGNDLRKVIYRLGPQGNPLTCDIFNEKGARLLKCRFGYGFKPGPSYGKMVEAQLLDEQKKPLQRLIYSYDATGAPAKPVTIALEPTGIAQRLLGTALVSYDPLADCNSASTPAVPR